MLNSQLRIEINFEEDQQDLVDKTASIQSLADQIQMLEGLNSRIETSENNLKDPVILGNIDAKISIIEYRSLTCSHCADFSKNGYKHLKEKYIDTGL